MSVEWYGGLCIGGPMNGQRAMSKTQRLYVDVKPSLKQQLKASVDEEIPTMAIERVSYNWHGFGGETAVWIVEGTTMHQAIEAMLVAYEKVHQP